MIRDLWCRISKKCHLPDAGPVPEAETLDLLHRHRQTALAETKKLRKAKPEDISDLLTQRGNVLERELFHEDGAP